MVSGTARRHSFPVNILRDHLSGASNPLARFQRYLGPIGMREILKATAHDVNGKRRPKPPLLNRVRAESHRRLQLDAAFALVDIPCELGRAKLGPATRVV